VEFWEPSRYGYDFFGPTIHGAHSLMKEQYFFFSEILEILILRF
jgi:hypothetical protein